MLALPWLSVVATVQDMAPLRPGAWSLPCRPVLGVSERVQQLFLRPLWHPSKTCVQGQAVQRLSWTLLEGTLGLLQHWEASAQEPFLPTAFSPVNLARPTPPLGRRRSDSVSASDQKWPEVREVFFCQGRNDSFSSGTLTCGGLGPQG